MRRLWLTASIVAMVGAASLRLTGIQQRGTAANAVAIDNDDIAGTVTSARGPESGSFRSPLSEENPWTS